MKKRSSKPENNNSLEDLQLDFKKETYFSSLEDNDNDDWLDDEQDDFFIITIWMRLRTTMMVLNLITLTYKTI